MQFGVHAALSRRRPRVQIPSGPLGIGSCPLPPGRVAQLAERAPEKREVAGSTPAPATLSALAPGRSGPARVPGGVAVLRSPAPALASAGRSGPGSRVPRNVVAPLALGRAQAARPRLAGHPAANVAVAPLALARRYCQLVAGRGCGRSRRRGRARRCSGNPQGPTRRSWARRTCSRAPAFPPSASAGRAWCACVSP